MKIDLGVTGSDSVEIESFCKMAHNLGFSGFATQGRFDEPVTLLNMMSIYRRAEIKGKKAGSIRKQIDRVRRLSAVVVLEIGTSETTNWAIENNRIDLLTVTTRGDHSLRATTASMAASAGVALEIQIAPLLQISGFSRSKILKVYRETITTAIENGMMVILTSGATNPMGLRSPVAMKHIGMLLGLSKLESNQAVDEYPVRIVQKNLKKMEPGYITPGVEVLQQGDKK